MWNDLSIRDRALLIRLSVGLGITNLDDILESYNQLATGGPKDSVYVAKPSSLYVKKPIIHEVFDNLNSPLEALKRTNQVFSNYNEAKDNPLSIGTLLFRNGLRYLKDNVYENIPAGISNCTLTATLWVDPNNPIKSAASIYNNPTLYKYIPIDLENAVPGNIVIAKTPNKESYHTMLISGFADRDGVYDFDGKQYPYKKGELLMTYSKGGHDESFIRRDVPLSVYNANSDGHTENYFYRYNYPNEVILPEIIIKPDIGNNKQFAEGGPKNNISDGQYYDIMEKVAEQNYKDWEYNNPDEALVHILNANDYDYRGYYNEFPNGDGNALDHWPNKYKTAYHPLFSNESIYSGKRSEYNPEGIIGGFWYKDNLIKSPEQIRWQSSIGLDKAFGGPIVQMANKFDGTTQPTQQMDRGNQPLYNGQIGFGFGYNPETFERYYTGFYNPYNNSYNNATWTDENNEYNVGLPTVTIRPSGESMVNRAQEKAAPVVRDVLLGSAALAGGIPALANAASKVPLSALKPGGAFWTNPLTQQMAAGTLAAEGINAGVKAITPYNSVGEGIGNTVEGITGWNPNNTWLGPIVTEAFNPGWYVSPTGMINTVGRVGNVVEKVPQIFDATARYVSPSYNLYRTISETTPRTTPTLHGFYSSDLTGSGFVEHTYTGSPLFEFGQTIKTSPEKAYFMRAPKDIDVLKLGNGKFRHEVVGNNILPSGEVNGKFVSYGEPWQEFALGENSALYEFPVGSGRGPGLMATDWKGRPQKYSVDEIYDYMQQEEAFRKELASIKENMGDDFLKQYSVIRKNLINKKYPTLKEYIDTSIHGANQTVIPNEKWNFDKFLKTPFWKYSENPISGQVQKELMMRWPETKPFEGNTIEWADAVKNSQITPENAASMTPEQWTAVQDAAIARGDMAEAQRLRDLHFKVSAPDTKVVDINENPQLVIHKTPNNFTVFDNSRSIGKLNWAATPKAFEGENGVFATGAGPNPKEMRLYVNMKNPHYPTIDEGMEPAFINEGEDGILGIVDKDMTNFYKSASDAGEGFNMSLGVDNPYALKSADAVTYDDKGMRIPLGERDNFNINDIRYGLLPFGIGLSAYELYSNLKSKGGKIYIKPSKRGTFTAAAKKHGKSVQAFASLVLANPSRYSAAMRKKANFARNAAKWHSYGGPIIYKHLGWDKRK